MPAAGTGTVDFGNCWGDPGNVVLYVDGTEVARAGPNQKHVTATIVFQPGSVLSIQDEGSNSVAMLSSVTLQCTGDSPPCDGTTTVTIAGSTSTEMNNAGTCCCCGQPQWFELAELKLFTADGTNVAPQASAVDLLLQPSNPGDVGVITDGQIWPAGTFVVWQNSHAFHGEALVRLTFPSEQVIVGAELYTTNYESFGTDAQVFAGSRSLPTRFVYAAHNQQGASHAACYMAGQEFATPCSTEDGSPGVGSPQNCGMNDAVVNGFAHIRMFQQDWWLVRRDHSIENGWHPVNDDLTGTADAYGTLSTDPLADSTWSVPFAGAFTEYLLASGDMSMWVTITKAELAARCGSCSNCQMTLTGSSNLGNPRQYCRAGSGEDPWISAGDHPDLIVYGEMSWSNHHIGQDGSEDALHRGGSNVWINALPPAPPPPCTTVLVANGASSNDPYETGSGWTTGGSDANGGYLARQGTGNFLRYDTAGVPFGTSDFTSRMRLSITQLAGSAATFEFNGNSHFGFVGSCQCVFAEGPFYGAFQNIGPPADFGILDDLLMDFVVQRVGNTFTISVNGVVVQTHTSTVPITSLGLRPHRANMRLYDWEVTVDTAVCPLSGR